MAEEFAIENEFEYAADHCVVDNHNQANDPVDAKRAEQDLSGGEQNVGNHVELGGVFTILWSLILREGPFARTGAVESIGEFGGEEDNKGRFGRAACKGNHNQNDA